MRLGTMVDVAAIVALGLAAGAMLAEGAILVPYWRALPPRAFLEWYGANASRLVDFFGPLEVASTVITVLAAARHGYRASAAWRWFGLAAVLAVAVLVSFPLYFQRVNASFATGTIAVERVPAELARWATWHWARTIVGVASFAAAAFGGARASRDLPVSRS